MKNKIDVIKRLLVFVFCLLIGLSASAQDIIKLKKGEELKAKVLKVTPSYIEYSYPDEDAVIQIQKRKVASIHYESGRVEEFAPVKLQAIKEETSKKVKEPQNTNNPLERKQMFYFKAGVALNKIHYYGKQYSILEDLMKFKAAEALDLGYSRYIKDSKFYWAAELGLATRGCYFDLGDMYLADMDDVVINGCYQYTIHHGIKIAPAIFGYRFMLPRDFAIDLRLGGYFVYYFHGKKYQNFGYSSDEGPTTWTWNDNYDDDDYDPWFCMQRKYNAGFETGIAFWYKRFCFDFTYNIGFVSFNKETRQPEGMADNDFWNALYYNPKSLDWKVRDKNYNYNIQFKLGIAF